MITLIYHIENQCFYVIKKILNYNAETEELINRETVNYSKLNHPLIPKFYGTTEKGKYIVIEFINGQTLLNIEKFHFSEFEKFTIIFQLFWVFKYLHENKYIYRDLKPNNVMIDHNGTLVVIDYDRLINYSNPGTNCMGSFFHAPEINSGKLTNKCDIYSLGKMLYYIIEEENPKYDQSLEFFKLKYPMFREVYKKCAKENSEERPSISGLLLDFCCIIYENIIFKYFKSIVLFNSEKIYENLDIVNKNIHYHSLAANQNDPEAQFNLGVFYGKGELVARDINKSIYYYTLAANQNDPRAQYNLGIIYEEGILIERDINKSIHYYTLAANQHLPQAQFTLGLIYEKGELIARDINKSIYYYTLAANQNLPQAQYNLGLIYEKGELIARDINKSIHYFTLAAKQNYRYAQYYLGYFYLLGSFDMQNIRKGIYWFEMSSKNRCIDAHFSLGFLYHEGKYFKRDIEQSIHFYKEASSFNHQYAKNNLGVIYYYGFGNEILPRGGAIVYFEEAIRQKNDLVSMYNLSNVYFYEITNIENINKSIELLIKSSNIGFYHSKVLLCIILIKKCGYNTDEFKKELKEQSEGTNSLLFALFDIMKELNLLNEDIFKYYYQLYSQKHFLYNILLNTVDSNDLKNTKFYEIKRRGENLNKLFYEGFGLTI